MSELDAQIRIGARLDESFDRAFRGADRRLEMMGEELQRLRVSPAAEAGVRDLGEEFRRTGRRAERALEGIGEELDETTRDIEEQRRAAGRLGDTYARMEGPGSGALRGRGGMAGGRGGGFGAGGVAVGMGGAAALGSVYGAMQMLGGAIDIDALEQRLLTAPGQDPEIVRAALDQIQADARGNLAEYAEMLVAAYGALGGGIAAELLPEAVLRAHQLGVATSGIEGSAEQPMSVMTGLMNQFGMTPAAAADMLAVTQAQQDVPDFATLGAGIAAGAPAAIAGATRMDPAEFIAAIGVLNTQKLVGAPAGTGMASLLAKLPAAAEELGVKLPRSADGAIRLADALDLLGGRLDRVKNLDERALVGMKAFGEEGVRIFNLLTADSEALRAATEANRGSAGTVWRVYSGMLESTAGQSRVATQAVADLGDTAGGPMAEGMVRAGKAVGKFSVAMAESVEESEDLRSALEALGEYLPIGGMIAALATGGLAAAGKAGAIAAAATGPAGLAIAGTTAVGLGLYEGLRYPERIRARTPEFDLPNPDQDVPDWMTRDLGEFVSGRGAPFRAAAERLVNVTFDAVTVVLERAEPELNEGQVKDLVREGMEEAVRRQNWTRAVQAEDDPDLGVGGGR